MKTKLIIMAIIVFLLLLALIRLSHAEECTIITSSPIIVTNFISDSGSGMGEMMFSVDNGLTWSDAQIYSSKALLTLPDLSDGKRYIIGAFSDMAGNWTPLDVYKACGIVDTTPPEGDGITIEGLTVTTITTTTTNIELHIN